MPLTIMNKSRAGIILFSVLIIVLVVHFTRRDPDLLGGGQSEVANSRKNILSASESPSMDSTGVNTSQITSPQAKLDMKSEASKVLTTNRVDAVQQPDNSLMVVTEFQSGQHAVLTPDGKMLSLRDGRGNIIWSNDIVAEIGDFVPLYFIGRMESMYVYGDMLVLCAGNGYYDIDKKNGKITRVVER